MKRSSSTPRFRLWKRPFRAAGALAVLGASVLLPATGASADTRSGMTVAPGQTVSKTYSAILVSDPVTPQDSDPTPELCADLPSCAHMPLTLAFPKGFDKTDDYFVRIAIFWETEVVKNPATGEATSNDLDLYVWERPKLKKGTTEIPSRKSATGGMPEKTALDRPQGNVVDLVLNNFAGTNNGFRVDVTWQIGTAVTPFEATEPGRTNSGSSDESFSKPVDLSDVPDSSSKPLAPTSFTDPGETALAPIGEDSDFSSLLGGLKGTAAVDAKDNVLTGAQKETSSAPPGDPSTLGLILALVVAPTALSAAGAAWFVKRRPIALTATA